VTKIGVLGKPRGYIWPHKSKSVLAILLYKRATMSAKLLYRPSAEWSGFCPIVMFFVFP
jgi:hypothetical protein